LCFCSGILGFNSHTLANLPWRSLSGGRPHPEPLTASIHAQSLLQTLTNRHNLAAWHLRFPHTVDPTTDLKKEINKNEKK
jgi:hypothetical protein